MPEVLRTDRVTKHIAALRSLLRDDYERKELDGFEMAVNLLPMKLVLKKVLPGYKVADKIKAIGITRSTWYTWMVGDYRPSRQQAKRLEQLTGISAERFQGRR